jgi:hypothetical protein
MIRTVTTLVVTDYMGFGEKQVVALRKAGFIARLFLHISHRCAAIAAWIEERHVVKYKSRGLGCGFFKGAPNDKYSKTKALTLDLSLHHGLPDP